jgi:hypothetical protein
MHPGGGPDIGVGVVQVLGEERMTIMGRKDIGSALEQSRMDDYVRGVADGVRFAKDRPLPKKPAISKRIRHDAR